MLFLLQSITLQLWDTAGQEGYDQIRVLGYENTHCFVVCFSVVDAVTFANVKNVWLKELRENAPGAKILLVGTKADLRETVEDGGNGNNPRNQLVSERKIKKLVKEERLCGYLETSAKRGGDHVDKVFLAAIKASLGLESNGDCPDGGSGEVNSRDCNGGRNSQRVSYRKQAKEMFCTIS